MAVAAEPDPEPEQELQATLVGPGERQQVRRRRIGHARNSGPAWTTASTPTPGAAGCPAQRPRATPPVRRYAKDRGVDLAALVGTGRDGRITREDVDGALDGAQDGARTAPGRRPRRWHPRPASRATGASSGSRFAAPAARSPPP